MTRATCGRRRLRATPRGCRRLLALLAAAAVPTILSFSMLACSKVPIAVNDPGLKEHPGRYLRYSLRGKDDGFHVRAYRSGYLSEPPLFKPGSRVEIRLYSDQRLELVIAGVECWLEYMDASFPTHPDGVRQEIEKHLAVTLEELNLEGLAPEIREQVEQGNAAIGMSKREVYTALGPPSHIDNYVPAENLSMERIFESSTWVYRYSETPVVSVYTTYWAYRFDAAGRLEKVTQ